MYGTNKANATMIMLLVIKYLLGLLFQKGVRLVLMTKTTIICEHNDSMNHAVWNKFRCSPVRRASGMSGRNTNNTVKNVKKSNNELTGPNDTMKRFIKPRSQRLGRSTYSSSTLSVVIVDWDMS